MRSSTNSNSNSNSNSIITFTFTIYFLLTLGPPLPTALWGHSMLEILGDPYIFGGGSAGLPVHLPTAIYRLTCSSGICSWSTINQELKVPRSRTVVIPVPDNFCLGWSHCCWDQYELFAQDHNLSR